MGNKMAWIYYKVAHPDVYAMAVQQATLET